MINWRIYYDKAAARDHGHSTFSNEDGEWVDAPIHGVVCIVVLDQTGAVGRSICSGWRPLRKHFAERKCPHCEGNLGDVAYAAGNNDFYVKYPDSDEPYSTPDLTPFYDRSDTDKSMVKFGRMVDADEWQAIMKSAVDDKSFPVGTPRRRSGDG